MSFVNWPFSAQVYAWYIWCIHVHGLAILDKVEGGGGSKNCIRWYTVNYDTVNQYVPSITQCKLALSFINLTPTTPCLAHNFRNKTSTHIFRISGQEKKGSRVQPLKSTPTLDLFNGIFVLMITFPFILQNVFNRVRHCGRKFLTDWFFFNYKKVMVAFPKNSAIPTLLQRNYLWFTPFDLQIKRRMLHKNHENCSLISKVCWTRDRCLECYHKMMIISVLRFLIMVKY